MSLSQLVSWGSLYDTFSLLITAFLVGFMAFTSALSAHMVPLTREAAGRRALAGRRADPARIAGQRYRRFGRDLWVPLGAGLASAALLRLAQARALPQT